MISARQDAVYKRIESNLLDKISRMRSGSKFPTEYELCKKFSVSRMTVNKALSLLVEKGHLYRIKGRGTFTTGKRSSETIKVLIPCPDFLTAYYYPARMLRKLIQGICHGGLDKGISIETIAVTADNNRNNFIMENLEALSKDHFVFVPGIWFKSLFEFLKERGCKVIYYNFQFEEKTLRQYSDNWHLLTIDNRGMGRDAVSFLKGKGRQRPAYLSPVYRNSSEAHPVLQGYLSGMNIFYPETGEKLLVEYYVNEDAPEVIEDRLLELWKKTKFDSLILRGTSLIANVQNAIAKLGLKVPDDLYLLSICDDCNQANADSAISTFHIDEVSIGKFTAELVAAKLPPGEKIFPTQLIERESTGGDKKSQLFRDKTDEHVFQMF